MLCSIKVIIWRGCMLVILYHSNLIHEQINDLYPCHGKTAEQEAALCLSLLMGYSVSMYANSEDEAKKKTVLRRSQMILKNQLPSPLKIQLHTIYDKLLS